MTLSDAKKLVRTLGMVISKNDGEYKVNFSNGQENTAYYTDDLDDAILTAKDMHNRSDNSIDESDLSNQDRSDIFNYSLKLSLNQCNLDDVPKHLRCYMEDQYKSPSGSHRRRQSAFRSSFNQSKSFGGVDKYFGDNKLDGFTFSERIDRATESIDEEQQVIKGDMGAFIAPNRGQFIIDGRIVIGNHSDLLKALVNWFVDNDLTTLQCAISSIKDQIESGAIYANIRPVAQETQTDE